MNVSTMKWIGATVGVGLSMPLVYWLILIIPASSPLMAVLGGLFRSFVMIGMGYGGASIASYYCLKE